MNSRHSPSDSIDNPNLSKLVEGFSDPAAIVDTNERVLSQNRAFLEHPTLDEQYLDGCDCVQESADTETPCWMNQQSCPVLEIASSDDTDDTSSSGDTDDVSGLSHIVGSNKQHFRLQCSPIYDSDDSLQAVLLIFGDVTNRERMSQTHRTLWEVIESAGHGVVVTNRTGTIEYVNPAFERITGYSATEAIGENPRLLNSGKHDDEFFEEMWETILNGEIWRSEIVNRHADGSLLHFDHTIAPILTDDGEISGFVAVFTEVTDRTIEREQLAVLYRVLRHNIRQVGSITNGYAETIQRSEVDEKITAQAATIQRAANRLTNLSEQAQKLRTGLQERDPHSTVDLRARLRVRVQAARKQYPNATVTLECDPESVEIKEFADLAIREVIDNALEHTGQQPVVNIRVASMSRDQTEWVRVEVEDDGPGLPEMERRILDERDESPLVHSTGIGLWFVNWMTELAGGTITIRDATPRGTIVELTYPMSE